MTFDYPEVLWWLLALPAAGILFLPSALRVRRSVRAVIGARYRDASRRLMGRFIIAGLLFALAMAALIIAIAGPRWGSVTREDERRGLDIIFLMDLSNSMLATDITPSRLERAREIARAVTSRLPAARVGLVAFSGGATTIVPLTEDPVAFDLAVSGAHPQLLTAPGTDVRSGIDRSLDAFPAGSARHRVVIVLSDGGSLGELPVATRSRVRESEVRFFSVVVGTSAGGVIAVQAGETVRVGTVTTGLAELAETSDGAVYRADDPDVVTRLSGDLQRIGGLDEAILFRTDLVSRYRFMAIVALAFLALAVLVQSVPEGRRG